MSKRSLKRSAALLVLALLLSALLQACSGGGGGDAGTSPSTSKGDNTSAGQDSGQLPPYEVSIVYFGKPEKDVALVQEKLNEYFKPKINATVALHPIASSD